MVTLTGGEPMLRTDIIEIIKGIKRAVPTVYLAMINNGSLMTLEKAKQLLDAGMNQSLWWISWMIVTTRAVVSQDYGKRSPKWFHRSPKWVSTPFK